MRRIGNRRIEQLLGALAHQPPTVVHAMSSASYRVARVVSEAFDADLVLQVTSLEDCDMIAGAMWDRLSGRPSDKAEGSSNTRLLAFTQPLVTVLEELKKKMSALEKKGIEKELLLSNCLITPSCGTGTLSVDLAERVMDVTDLLSKSFSSAWA